MDSQVRGCVGEMPVFHVDHETEVTEEVGSNNRLLDICYDENPLESATESEVECE